MKLLGLPENAPYGRFVGFTDTSVPAVGFLTRTYRNVLYVRVGKRYVRLWHSQRSRTVEEASGEMEVGRRAVGVAPAPRTPLAAM